MNKQINEERRETDLQYIENKVVATSGERDEGRAKIAIGV